MRQTKQRRAAAITVLRVCFPLVCLAGLLTAQAQAQKPPVKPPRLALVATEQTPAIQNLLTLTEVKLSAASELQLLERRALEGVLAEHKLALSGYLKSDQVLQAGKLLGVDLFALVEADKTGKGAAGLVVFDARTGVRLWDAGLESKGLDDAGAALAGAVLDAVRKNRQQGKDLQTICLTTVRNVDLPRDQDVFCDTVGHLLERGLVKAPNLALLERSRLDQVNQERNLPTDSPLRPLLASLVRIELEVGRSHDGKGLRGAAHLVGSDGKLLGKHAATVSGRDAHDLALALVKEVTKALKTRPPMGTGDRQREAFRLHFEAEFLRRHNDKVRELRARETVCALMPDYVEMRNNLVQTLLERGEEILRPYHVGLAWHKTPPLEDLQRSLAHYKRSADLLLSIEPARLKDPRLSRIGCHALALSKILRQINALDKGHSAETRTLLQQIQEHNLVLLEMRQDHDFNQVNDKATFEAYTFSLGHAASPFSVQHEVGLNAEQLKKNRQRVLPRWLDTAEKYGTPPLGAKTVQAASALLGFLEGLDNFDQGRVRAYRKALGGDHAFALSDKLTALKNPKLSPAELHAGIHDFRLSAQKLLQMEEVRRSESLSYNAYRTVEEAILLSRFIYIQHAEYRELCRFMLGQNDLVPSVAGNVVGNQEVNPKDASQVLDLCDQILKLAESSKVRWLLPEVLAKSEKLAEAERARLKGLATRGRLAIVSRFPNLGAPAVAPWVKVQELIDLTPWPPRKAIKSEFTRLVKPLVHDGFVYVAMLGQTGPRSEDRFVQLLRFSLASGAKEPLGKIAIDTTQIVRSSNGAAIDRPEFFAVDAVIHNGRYFLGTRGKGILIFSVNGAKVERLDTEAGMPSGHVFALTCIADKLYAGLGVFGSEGYLIAHDLNKNHTTVLASSRRKDRLSPFDDTTPLSVRFFAPDPKRQRALFLAKVENKKDLSGLWSIDVKTNEMKRLTAVPEILQRRLEWTSPLHQDKMVLAFVDLALVLDAADNKLEPIPFHAGSTPSRLSTWRSVADQGKVLADALTPKEGMVAVRSGDFFHQGWLWTSFPFGRSSLDDARREVFPSLRPKASTPFVPSELLHLAGNRLVIADAHGLWLATLDEAKLRP